MTAQPTAPRRLTQLELHRKYSTASSCGPPCGFSLAVAAVVAAAKIFLVADDRSAFSEPKIKIKGAVCPPSWSSCVCPPLVALCVYVSVCVCVSGCLSWSAGLSPRVSVYLSVRRSLRRSVYLSTCPSVRPSLRRSVYLSICLLVCLFVSPARLPPTTTISSCAISTVAASCQQRGRDEPPQLPRARARTQMSQRGALGALWSL